MASFKKYNTYIIGFPETVNTCPRIIVCNSSDIAKYSGDISLFNISDIVAKILDPTSEPYGLVISRDEKGAFDISKCGLISYANGGYYAQGEKLGRFGFSVQKKQKKQKKKSKK